jgi:hypothetical protein
LENPKGYWMVRYLVSPSYLVPNLCSAYSKVWAFVIVSGLRKVEVKQMVSHLGQRMAAEMALPIVAKMALLKC